jgi:DNA adenine methylase
MNAVVQKQHILQAVNWSRFDLEEWLYQFYAWSDGGKNQTGKYQLDARYNKKDLTKRIEKIGEYCNRIKVYNIDALELLGQVDNLLPENSLIYLDPPYYVKGQGLYRNFYIHDDHVKIRKALDKISSKWIVSYDNCSEIKEIYDGYYQEDYELNYSAYYKTKGSEVMIYSDKINPVKIPEIGSRRDNEKQLPFVELL